MSGPSIRNNIVRPQRKMRLHVTHLIEQCLVRNKRIFAIEELSVQPFRHGDSHGTQAV